MASLDTLLLDEILPQYDVSAVYSIRIRATADQIYRVLQQGLPTGAITKILMALRSVPRLLRKEPCESAENAFYKLKQLENREMVIGIVGQFWKPVSEPLPIHSLDEFMEFQKEGYCKAALNLRIIQKNSRECLLTTETRVLGFGTAKQKFKKYWQVIGPFSGLIRREILRKIKKKAESL